ncbi:MAG TPA: DNA-processing protein DprA [Gemmatimonadaceae bacterium]
MSTTPTSLDADALRAAVALAQLPGVGCAAFREHVGRYGSAAAAFAQVATRADRDAALAKADDALARARACGAHILVLGEPGYPERLLDVRHPPSVCFALGRLELLDRPAVSIVGTRSSSQAGERFTHRIAGHLAQFGAVIVSGMARGIDAAAHRGALDAGGSTIAVLAGGCDVPYPPTHRALHRQIVQSGLVLSETPPGDWSLPGGFLRRNRIIAALGHAVIVVEAGAKSGATTTADLATGMGRSVGAVPGWVDSPRSIGTNELLHNGATIIRDVHDARQLASRATNGAIPEKEPETGARATAAGAAPSSDGDPAADAVLRALGAGAASLDEVAVRTGLAARDLGAAISTLEVAGVVWSDHRGALRLVR